MARKSRLVFRLTIGAVTLVTGIAFLFLALTGTKYDLMAQLQTEKQEKTFDWDSLADSLPPLEQEPPEIFSFEDGENSLFPEAQADEEVVQTPEVGEIRETDGMSEAEIRRRGDKVKQLVEDGDRLFRRRRFKDAEDSYMEAVKLQPSLKSIIGEKFFEQAQRYERQRSWSRAKLLYRMSLHFDYQNTRYHLALARTSDALGDARKAAEHRRLAQKFADAGN